VFRIPAAKSDNTELDLASCVCLSKKYGSLDLPQPLDPPGPAVTSIYLPYKFRPNWSSSGVQVVLMKESAAHCNAVLLFLCVNASNCSRLHGLSCCCYARVCIICNM
jgi:hypothetical protein